MSKKRKKDPLDELWDPMLEVAGIYLQVARGERVASKQTGQLDALQDVWRTLIGTVEQERLEALVARIEAAEADDGDHSLRVV